MKQYGLNKIFVEGESDKRFIDFLLKKFYNIENAELVIDVKGKDKLKNNPLLIDERRKAENAKNLIIFDTDFSNSSSKGGRDKRLEEYNKIADELSVKFKIFLLPFNNEKEGILEDLLDTCFKSEFSFFDTCWQRMIECIKNAGVDNLNIPEQKAFVYSKFDLFRYKGGLKKEDKPFGFDSEGIWNFDRNNNNGELDTLLKFIEDNLFIE